MSTFREIIGCRCGMQHHCGEAFSQKSKQPLEKAREGTIYCSYVDMIQCNGHRTFITLINTFMIIYWAKLYWELVSYYERNSNFYEHYLH